MLYCTSLSKQHFNVYNQTLIEPIYILECKSKLWSSLTIWTLKLDQYYQYIYNSKLHPLNVLMIYKITITTWKIHLTSVTTNWLLSAWSCWGSKKTLWEGANFGRAILKTQQGPKHYFFTHNLPILKWPPPLKLCKGSILRRGTRWAVKQRSQCHKPACMR